MNEQSIQHAPGGRNCEHGRLERVSRLYVDGRPLYRCLDCDAHLVDESDDPSFKGLAALASNTESRSE